MEPSMKKIRFATGAAVAMLGMACADMGAPSGDVVGAVAAFESVPAGFSSTSSTFAAEGDLGLPFQPHRGDGSFEDHGMSSNRGPGGRDGRGGPDGDDDPPGPGRDGFGFLMGGGLGPDFFGGIGFGEGRGRGPFHMESIGESCVFASSTGVVTCGPVTRHGLTVLATATIKNAAGAAQSKIDSLTNGVALHSEVSGTVTRRDSATSVINHKSDRTVTGLAKGSTQRTVDGTAVGTETTTGTTDAGDFEAIRTVNDTTVGIIVPLADGRPTYPTAGRISRNMSVSL